MKGLDFINFFSERQSQTGTVGDRFKEATNINKSLTTLGNVLEGEWL